MKKVVISILILFLAGCTARKHIAEDVDDKIYKDTYISTIAFPQQGLGKFSVYIPQSIDYNEFESVLIEEEIRDIGTSVAFGPSITDQTLYKVVVVFRSEGTIEEYNNKYIPNLAKLAEEYHNGAKMTKLYTKDTVINGNPAIFQVYQQESIPLYTDHFGREHKNVKFIYAVYFIFYKKYMIPVWIQIANIGSNAVEDPQIIIDEKWRPQRNFVESIQLYAQ